MKTNNQGFSLIQVLIATMIFAGSILEINSVWSGNFFRIKKSTKVNQAVFLLKQKITEYEIQYNGKNLQEIPEKEAGNFGEKYKNYSWTMESRKFEMPNLASAINGGEEQGGNELVGLLVKTMTEFIGKSVKEVKVTVSVSGFLRSKKSLSYSATTLFVDYEQEINLPGIGGGGGSSDDSDGDDS